MRDQRACVPEGLTPVLHWSSVFGAPSAARWGAGQRTAGRFGPGFRRRVLYCTEYWYDYQMDTRTRILDAALGLVAEGGVQELTQPRVSRAAGVRQSHLTYYFPTIADLVQAVARHTVDALVAEVSERPRGRRAGALVEHVAAATADKRRVRVMLALVSAADRDPALRPRLRELIRELRAGIAGALGAAGIEAGADEVAFLHTVVVGTAVLQLARDDAPARRETRRVLQRAVAGLPGKG